MDITLINLGILSVGIVIAATGLLGFVAFFNNPKSASNKTFLIFCLLTIIWGSLNYLSYNIHTPPVALWLFRISIFFAVWHSFFLFHLLYIFPRESVLLPKTYTNILVPIVSIIALLNLTPLTFKQIGAVSASGQVTKIVNGPGILLFSLATFGLIISGIVILIKKIRSEKYVHANQLRHVMYGIVATFSLILLFNLVFPAFLNNSDYIAFGALFIFPFIVGTSYSIIKHGFLNIKIISTEILTFILSLVILLEVVTSTNLTTLVFRLSIFLLVICLGVLLIKSVIKEVQQRELLEILSKQLSETNKQLKVLDQARSEFISIASHQLRTPPATVKWYLSSILGGDYGKLSKEVKDQLLKTQNTNNALISLIEDMLNVSRIERGTMEFLFEEVDLEPLAQMTVDQLMPMAQEKKLKLSYQKPSTPLPKIMADKEKIRQVINNLIDNAIKYTQKGEITVKLFKNYQTVEFQVQDTGKGIAPEDEGKIFEKFSRGKDSLNHAPGLGLGLYVAKIVIEQHKGKIWVDSPGQNLGSTFNFQLPIRNHLKASSILDLTKQA